jgi:hypothetical protein
MHTASERNLKGRKKTTWTRVSRRTPNDALLPGTFRLRELGSLSQGTIISSYHRSAHHRPAGCMHSSYVPCNPRASCWLVWFLGHRPAHTAGICASPTPIRGIAARLGIFRQQLRYKMRKRGSSAVFGASEQSMAEDRRALASRWTPPSQGADLTR